MDTQVNQTGLKLEMAKEQTPSADELNQINQLELPVISDEI